MISSISFDWFHWFDLFLIIAIGIGVYINRHANALDQILGVIQWLLVLAGTAFLTRKPAMWVAESVDMRPDVAALILYPLIAAFIYFIIAIRRRSILRQAEQVEFFGRQEYRVAMFMGGIKAFLIVFVSIAWLHGRYVTEEDLRAYKAFCQDNFGNIEWPVPATVREDVFEKAYTGKTAGQYFDFLLLKALPPLDSQLAAAKAKGNSKEVKISAKGGEGPGGADAVIDELENGRNKKRKDATTDVATGTRNHETIYHELMLKGISGTGAQRLALINNQALKQGESELVKVEKKKVKVYCEEIRDSSVVIRVDDEPELVELQLNAASSEQKR